MDRLQPFMPATLFCGVIYRDPALLLPVKTQLASLWSAVEMESDPVPFDFTDYYTSEMGAPLFRTFWVFQQPIDPSSLPERKKVTEELEQRWSLDGRRRINLDPGYLNQHQVVIATCKNQAHRIPLQDGIYAHLELLFRGGAPFPLPWTYPDFRGPAYHEFLVAVRRQQRERDYGEKSEP